MLGDLNIYLFNLINHTLHNGPLDILMTIITKLANTEVLFLLVIISIIVGIIIKNENIRNIGILCFVGLILAMGVAFLLKHGIHEPRPYITLSDVNLLVKANDPYYSFPSGHSTRIFVIITLLIFNIKTLFKNNTKLISLILGIIGVLILISRVYVGDHYPLDVIGGAILGTIIGLITNYYLKEYILNISDKILNLF